MKSRNKAAIAVLALVTTIAPLTAQAQDRGHGRDYRYEDRGPHRGDRRPDRAPPRYDARPDRGGHYGHRPPPPAARWSRSNRDWWRGHHDFRDYRGARANYWYAPGYGYYRVEPRYYGRHWRQGAYLPPAYRSYYVRDPGFYGLRAAPRGYRYVHAGNDIVMIAIATGLITSVLSGVY